MNETGLDGIQGAWNYIGSAYGIVYSGLLLYTASLLRRLRDLKRERERTGGSSRAAGSSNRDVG